MAQQRDSPSLVGVWPRLEEPLHTGLQGTLSLTLKVIVLWVPYTHALVCGSCPNHLVLPVKNVWL